MLLVQPSLNAEAGGLAWFVLPVIAISIVIAAVRDHRQRKAKRAESEQADTDNRHD